MAFNRLEQIAHLEDFLYHKFGFCFSDFRMRAVTMEMACQAQIYVACNYADIIRYRNRDLSLGGEPPIFFPDRERNGCLEKCRIAGNDACVCRTGCFPDERCRWLRHVKGQRACSLVMPGVLDEERCALRTIRISKPVVLEAVSLNQAECLAEAEKIFFQRKTARDTHDFF